MKNKLKLMIITILSMAVLTGCGAKSPTEVVENYFSELKKGENAEVTEYLLDTMENSTQETDKEESESEDTQEDVKINEAMEIYASKLDAKVLKEEINEDKATVEVELEAINFADIMMELIGESFQYALSGKEISEDEMSNMILEKVKVAKLETRTGKMNLSKVDNEWKIDVDEDAYALLFGKADIKDNSNY